MKKYFTVFALCVVLTGSTTAFSFSSMNDGDDSDKTAGNESVRNAFDEHSINLFIDDLLQRIESRAARFAEKDGWHGEDDSTKNIEKGKEGAITFNGNTEIGVDDKIDGDIVVKGGTLTVLGVVDGDALVVNGNIVVKDGGKITGNARAINGKVTKEDRGVIGGYMEEKSSASDAEYSSWPPHKPRSSRTFNDLWLDEQTLSDNFIFRYNRVEGFFFGLGSEKKFYWDGSRQISGYGSVGYGFKIHRWRANLGIDRQFATASALYEIGIEGHNSTSTKDEWIMGLGENNAVALLWHEDYRDYYTRQGASVHAARYSKEKDFSTQFMLEYLVDKYASLPNGTNWSIFRQSRSFRENPAVNEGVMHSIRWSFGLSTLAKERRQTVGWNIFVSAEKGGDALKGDFNFTQTIFDLRRFQPLSGFDNLNVRLRVGSLEGDHIVQKSFELGGANTLPAYGFKEFSGNRMVLGNVEYVLHGRAFSGIFFWPSSFSMIVFFDAGAAQTVAPSKNIIEGFSGITSSTLKSDVGFAIGWTENARLGFAWRTDAAKPVSIFLRFSKPF
ncbi:MAG: hypothetical protein KGJ59_10560 [Bacteroidota bacterium]|nr:hypothetical protein [Bacteroidota bacterium]